ncbi:TPA: conjugal transfer protein TraJ [Enterobacter asburiae]|nr:conjugal transfer protein TraJ [Enterobacter ludwigii]OZP65923.1 conjugal transfer protein TraJ [Enterobacter asburiae]QBB08670.1 conjugal transfer protein TraJ [Enterobacter cloacae]HCL5492611.1 conjugal transfer protein TraJ [Citrobacter freundii]HCM6637622.1 conjugal transfer protein TraJ [Klebsiella pneumoniae]
MAFMDNEFTLWKFCHVQRGPFFMPLYPSKTLSKVNDFKKAIRMFGEVKFETFALYCLGASHQVISEVLSIQESTSKRRVNRIYADLPVKSRDEVYYLIFASGVASQLFKVASEILSRRVTRLLNK